MSQFEAPDIPLHEERLFVCTADMDRNGGRKEEQILNFCMWEPGIKDLIA